MRRVAFLCSGGGGNYRCIRRCVEDGILKDVEIAGVIGDRACGALEAAERDSVRAVRVAYAPNEGGALRQALKDLSPDAIVTAFDRILDAETVEAFAGRMINLHYSLLPAFAGTTGLTPVRQALEKGCRVLGTTVHVVVPAVDAGPILAQSAYAARAEDFARTGERAFRCGAVALVGVIARLGSKGPSGGWSYRADVDGFFAPAVELPDGVFDAGFWARVA